jgi:hypothetical protein
MRVHTGSRVLGQTRAFLFSVKGDYACLAFCLSEKNYGTVVAAYAPDFDAVTSPLRPSFREFINSYSAVLKEEESNPNLNDLYDKQKSE